VTIEVVKDTKLSMNMLTSGKIQPSIMGKGWSADALQRLWHRMRKWMDAPKGWLRNQYSSALWSIPIFTTTELVI